ncbi:hypothetical protein SAMN06264364_12058 [Quadrisphaera granulorum]|uniref:Short-subunit dehydrogenase n=1 Tax=Quadrisphaera granulorum TaxID=317664 RepID=A0A316A4B6_9ACTN|nr:SDR family NAD(P)-dependent oxidoreductase [Quadrisphaera granulorum]PWJ51780.1 hypothetical protein BXY45_12058 [Quadrisphaera granulorum]SZE97727.1 hypothetical protein SAMN06264364_12058 [Quadrisphaera granulorum]
MSRTASFQDRYGPLAVVTGASSGLGCAAALRAAELGLNTALVARSAGRLEEVAVRVRERGRRAHLLPADLATPEGRALVESFVREHEVGLLVAAAGFGTTGPLAGSDLEEELGMITVNCTAALQFTRAAAQQMTARRRGGIVLFGSILGRQGVPGASSYAATKAWAQVLAEGLHAELRPAGVDVVACAPGPVRTGFADRAGMTMGRADDPAVVVASTFAALGGRVPVVSGGGGSRLLTLSLATAPRPLRTRILAGAVARMSGAASTR